MHSPLTIMLVLGIIRNLGRILKIGINFGGNMRLIVVGSFLLSTLTLASIDAPSLSDRQYRHITLPNALKVLLISDPSTDKAAASMDVFVGTNNDPEEFPGLAHFLEHMLFLGTNEYPEAGEYQQFISDQGGSNNAYTAPEHTNYYFAVDPKGLPEALNRFSRFFVSPRFDPAFVKREVNAVHAEYQSKLSDPGRLNFEATKQGLNPQHPFSKFGAGNLSTLEKPGLIQALKSFYETEYSANRMALVVLGKEPLDLLESMIATRFKDIPNKQLTGSVNSTPLFDLSRLPMVIQSRPTTEKRQLTLLFPVPDTTAFIDRAPLRYLAHLIGHEGHGSLINHLKAQGYANSISAGESIGMADHRSFAISISLTLKGFQQRDDIIQDIFNTVRLIETEGLDAWRFDELKLISNANFRFAEESDPKNIVAWLANRLQSIPPQDLFTKGRKLTQFDKFLTEDMLSWLTPTSMLLRVVAPEIEPSAVTEYFPTEIHSFRLPNDRFTPFQSARQTASLVVSLPKPNPFIKDLSAPLPITRKATSDTQPQAVIMNDAVSAYVLTENRFAQPRSDLYIRLRTPLASHSPEAVLMAGLLADSINEHFNSLSYNAALAGAGFSAQATQSGITLRFSGFHASVITLAHTILDKLPIPLTSELVWSRLRELKAQSLASVQSAKPSNRLFNELAVELMPRSYSNAELNEAFEIIDRATFHQYQKAFFSGVKAEIFLHGPINRDEGLRLVKQFVSKIPVDDSIPDTKVTTNTQSAESEYSYTYTHEDQAAAVMFVDDMSGPDARILNQLAGNLIEAPFYTHLRTEKQLGYIAFATAFPLFNTPVLIGVIQSPTANPDLLAHEINTEFMNFVDMVADMPNDQFNQQRLSLFNKLLNPPLTQGELSNAIWRAIGLRLPFNDRISQANVIKGITQDQFVKYLKNRIQNPLIFKAYRPSS